VNHFCTAEKLAKVRALSLFSSSLRSSISSVCLLAKSKSLRFFEICLQLNIVIYKISDLKNNEINYLNFSKDSLSPLSSVPGATDVAVFFLNIMSLIFWLCLTLCYIFEINR
jgi:hypothetical protein